MDTDDRTHLISRDDDSDTESVLELPEVVRDTVPLKDDPHIPVVTVRYIILSLLFVIPGAFVDTMNSYRTTSAAYSIFFVQIVGHWAGQWCARVIPKNQILSVGRHKLNLNPGPWSIKETALLTITAASGATGNLATNALSLADLYFDTVVPKVIAIPFMFAIVFVGYSYAAICKDVLVYDTTLPFPATLMQTALLQSQAKNHGKSAQMRVFFYVLGVVAVWQLLPMFIMPMVSSLAILCWIAPQNSIINFIGSGLGGMGFLNFSLDWANVTSQVMILPYWVQIIQFVAFVIGAWILIPWTKWGNLFDYKYGLMSNRLFTFNGTSYPTTELLGSDLQLNVTAYAHYGPVYLGPQRAWNMFFDYAAYISGGMWIVLFGWDKIQKSFTRTHATRRTDRLNHLYSKYPEIPMSWYRLLFLSSFGTLLVIFLSGQMFMPWWACIVALMMGGLIVTPLAWLYALSNFQLAIGTFNELIYGFMIQYVPKRHPVGALVFGSIAGDAWYRAQFHLDSLRLGFYNHLPPRYVFWAQLYGEFIGIPINHVAYRWIIDSKRQYLNGSKIDPSHQWTGQAISASHTNAIQYVVLGPSRLFTNYKWLPYGFLVGLLAPILIFRLHRRYTNVGFDKWNTTVFFSSMSRFYGNISTGYLSRFIGGTITMWWAYNHRHSLWKRYNYIVAAACDTGLNLALLVIFLAFTMVGHIEMPHWWGNNAENVERCFALQRSS